MTLTITLSRYIARQFVTAIAAAWVALSRLVAMFDFLELLRRSASKPDATFTLVGEIAALRIPFIMMQILPFAVLLGGLLCFWRLTRTSELIVARAAGVSAWEFLTVPTLCALLMGAVTTAGAQSAVVGDAGAGRGAGDRLHPDRRRSAGAERRPALAPPVGP